MQVSFSVFTFSFSLFFPLDFLFFDSFSTFLSISNVVYTFSSILPLRVGDCGILYGIFESESEVVEVSAVNEMTDKEVSVEPVDMTKYVYYEVCLGIEQVVSRNYPFRDVQKKPCWGLVEPMGMH